MNDEFISVFWAWNSDLKKEDLEAQLVDYKEKGINNVFVHARAGLKVEYMGDTWMDSFMYSLEVAKRIGIHIWIYDEKGWPSGFGGGKVYEENEDYKMRFLYNFYDSYSNILKSKREIVSVYDDNYSLTDANDITDKNKKYNFICICVNDYYVDITNKDATKCFLSTTHEVYKKYCKDYFGNVIPGVFTDEPHTSPEGIHYSKGIKSEFENRYNLKFKDIIKYLFFDIGEFRYYRYLYRKLLSEMIRDNYSKVYKKWCDDNNLILTGHYTCEEGLFDQVPTSGRLTSLYDQMGLIGVDALGNRLVPLPTFRRTMSIASQTGKNEVLAETFAGTGYDSSFNELLRIYAYEAINGVTHPCLSISMSSIEGNRKRDYPQFFSRQMPWWENSKYFFDEMKFITSSLKGERRQDVLVIEPISSIFLGDKDSSIGISSSFRVLTESLYYSEIDFDYGDEEKVADAVIKDNKIYIGKCSYSKIILPYSINIESGVLSKLKEFSDNGGLVFIVTPLPTFMDGKENGNIPFNFKYLPIMNRMSFIRKLSEVYNFTDTVIKEKYTRKTNTRLSTAFRYRNNKEHLFVLNQDRNEVVEGRIVTNGEKIVNRITSSSTETLSGVYSKFENKTEYFISLKPMEYVLYEITPGKVKEIKEEIISSSIISPNDIELGLNSLVIDQASISINNSPFDESDYVIKKTGKFFTSVNGKGKSLLKAKYEFNIVDLPTMLYATGEYSDSKVYINGSLVSKYKESFYSDAKRADITKYIKAGKNELIIEKENDSFYDPILGKDVFQSIFNVFSFPYYIESLILEGDFKVETNESVNTFNYLMTDGEFKIIKDDKRISNDLTTSGYPFYRGKVKSTYLYNYSSNSKVYVEIDNTFSISNNLIINGKNIYIGSSYRIDITDYLIKGLNTIYLVEYTGLRNTFGPFHHKYGKHYYTGPSVFEGYAEWQDFVIYPELKGNTYVNEYSFVHFYVPDLRIIEKEIKSNDND